MADWAGTTGRTSPLKQTISFLTSTFLLVFLSS